MGNKLYKIWDKSNGKYVRHSKGKDTWKTPGWVGNILEDRSVDYLRNLEVHVFDMTQPEQVIPATELVAESVDRRREREEQKEMSEQARKKGFLIEFSFKHPNYEVPVTESEVVREETMEMALHKWWMGRQTDKWNVTAVKEL